jgi:hypothetical protein
MNKKGNKINDVREVTSSRLLQIQLVVGFATASENLPSQIQ